MSRERDELVELITQARIAVDEVIGAVGRKTIETVRKLAGSLRPGMLDDLGLESALRWYTNRQAALSGLRGEFHADALAHRLDPQTGLVTSLDAGGGRECLRGAAPPRACSA